MADVITRFKLESSEYNSKIKRATQGLLQMEQECRKVGDTLAILEKDQLEFVKGLGQMETVSKSARGRLSELTQAYTELSMQYKRLTDEEKNGDFGKALSASLEQLKTRIGETKTQLGDITKEMNGGGGLKDALDAVAGKFGLSIDQVTKFGGVVAVTTTAVKVAKDAFFQSESNIDEWGRTVEGAKGAYDVFLQTINNGNWSNFFQNLSEAIRGARDLYDALDRLGSIKSNNQAAIAIVQQQIAQLRLMKQQGQDVDDQLKAATANLAALQKQAVTAGKNAGAATMQQTIRNGVNSMGGAAVSDRDIQAAIGGILYKGQAEFDKYKETVNKFENWSKAQRTTVRQISDSQGGVTNITETKFDINLLTKEQQRQYKLAKAITERETEIQKGISIYAQAVQEGTANAREEFKGNRYALQGSTGGGKGGSGGGATTAKETYVAAEGSIDAQAEKVRELTKLWSAAADQAGRDGYKKQLDEAQAVLDQMRGKVKDVTQEMATGISGLTPEMLASGQADIKKQMQTVELGSEEYNNLADRLIDYNAVSNLMQEAVKTGLEVDDETREAFATALLNGGKLPQETIDGFVESLNYFKELAGDNPITLNVNTGEIEKSVKKQLTDAQKTKMAWDLAGQSIQNIATAFNAIEDPGVKAMGTVIKAIADISLGFAQASVQASSLGPWGWLAWLAAGTAAMATTISSVHSLTGFAEGGIIKGNSYSGDRIGGMVDGSQFVGLNAGELVLNKSQQMNLASQLDGGGMGGLHLSTVVTAEDIKFILNNNGERIGVGEYFEP